jgi:Ca2+-binding RTX toxin-like protein
VTNHFLVGDFAIDYVQPASGPQLTTAAINALVSSPGGGDGDYPSVIQGTAAGETLLGTTGRDLIRGLGGDDDIFGFQGDDKFEGGDGNDDLYGGNGSFSGSGNDILIGGAGTDMLVGEDGDDSLFGGAGTDTYYYAAGSGRDVIDNTGGGGDWIYFAGIARGQLSFHRDGNDLIVRVGGNSNEQVRVLNHFVGGEYAIAFVQPGDGGAAIPASSFVLSPLSSSNQSAEAASLAMDFSGFADTEEPIAVTASVDARRELSALIDAMSSFESVDTVSALDTSDNGAERSMHWNLWQHSAHRDGAGGRYLEP